MANNLNIMLEGKYVIVNPLYYGIPYVFKCEGGFGCYPFTNGSGIGGFFLIDSEKTRIEGDYILRLATEQEVAEKQVSRQILEDTLKNLAKDYRELKMSVSKMQRINLEIADNKDYSDQKKLELIIEEQDKIWDENYSEGEYFN